MSYHTYIPTLLLFSGLTLGTLYFLLRLFWHHRCKKSDLSLKTILQKLHSENGSASMEFVLVIPFLTFFLLTLLQITLMMVGTQYVQHASWRACRSAMVLIPETTNNEERNYFSPTDTNGKHGDILRGVALSLAPVSGRLGNGSGDGIVLKSGLSQYFSTMSLEIPEWVQNLIAPRYQYAIENTELTYYALSSTQTGAVVQQIPTNALEIKGNWLFGPKDSIMIEVKHRFNLSIPYVRGLFSDGKQDTIDGPSAYTTMRSKCMHVLEGIDTDMPDPAPVPRATGNNQP